MLLKFDYNKWTLRKLLYFDNLYFNASPTRLLQISKKYYTVINFLQKNSHILSDTLMLSHRIILFIQSQGQKFQNGDEY